MYMFPVLWTEFAIMLYPGHGLVIMFFVYIIPSLTRILHWDANERKR